MGNFSKWVKIISADSNSIVNIDSSAEVFGKFGSENALIFDHEAKVLYFLDSASNDGVAQKISASTECPLYIIDGDDNIIEYNGSTDVSIDSSLLHRKHIIDSSLFEPKYLSGSMNIPYIVIDEYGHIINTTYANIQLTGDDDASLVTVAKTAILFAEYASKFEIEACGNGTSVGYILPNPENTGKSYKCVDAHEYYYADGVTKITYEDEEGNIKNPGAGDVIICSATKPAVKWNVIVNKYDLYDDKITGLVPAYGDASNAILFAEKQWGYLTGSKGIKIENNKNISHINDISSGTIGQQHDQDGNPTDDLFIPHCVSTKYANPNFVISIPKITYDTEGHIASVVDSSVTVEVSKIVGGNYPSLSISYIDSFNTKTYVYDPEDSDVSISLKDIRAKSAEDSSKFAGKMVTTNILDFGNNDGVIPTARTVGTYVSNYILANTDSSLSTTSTNAVQNKVVYNEILTRDACVYERIDLERSYVDENLILKADKSNVIEKDSSIEYTPTENYHPTNKLYVDIADTSLRNEKQDKLIPGPGVIIDGSIISFSADMFIVIDGYVEKTESDTYLDKIALKVTNPVDNKIYLWRLYDPIEGLVSNPIYIEFSYDFNSNPSKWVELGRFRLDFLIDNRLKEIDSSIRDLQEEHVFLSEDEYERMPEYLRDPNKIYFTYESDGPGPSPSGDIEAVIDGEVLRLKGNAVYYDESTQSLIINSSSVTVDEENEKIIIN